VVTETVVEKIRFGRLLSGKDVSPETSRTGEVLKLLAPNRCLLAVVEWNRSARRWVYCCVMSPDACRTGVC
jgi:hypothetical protein